MDIKTLHQLFLQCTNVSTDTRKIETDTMFFALKGANFDGNQYAEQALEKGAKYVVVSEMVKPDTTYYSQYIVVKDTLETLQKLANYHRKQFDIPVIGITGTNGKTTSKELIYQTLSSQYKVWATQGNFNNHIGVPLTLLQITKEHEMAIIEMGANHLGEIEELCQIAEPNYAYITNVGSAHLEGFGSVENIFKTKLALYQYVEQRNGGVFLLEENTNLKEALAQEPTLSFSINNAQASFYSEINTNNVFVSLHSLKLDGKLYEGDIPTHLTGKYNHSNIMAAICIAHYFKVDVKKIQEAITAYQPNNNRSQWQKSSKNELILDAYNANPTSTRLAIENILLLDKKEKTIILGDMLELGDYAIKAHQDIVELLKDALNTHPNLKVLLVGECFYQLKEDQSAIQYYKSAEDEDLQKYISELHQQIILLKGSRGIRLEQLIPYL